MVGENFSGDRQQFPGWKTLAKCGNNWEVEARLEGRKHFVVTEEQREDLRFGPEYQIKLSPMELFMSSFQAHPPLLHQWNNGMNRLPAGSKLIQLKTLVIRDDAAFSFLDPNI